MVSIDALMPTVAVVLTGVFAWLRFRWERKETNEKLDGIHILVNDLRTREMTSRLALLKSVRVLVKEQKGENQAYIHELDERIIELEKEIRLRDATADSLTEGQKIS